MSRSRIRSSSTLAVVVVMVVGSLGPLGVASPTPSHPVGPTAIGTTTPAPSTVFGSASPSGASPLAHVPTGAPASVAIDTAAIGANQAASARALATGINPQYVFLPRPSATAAELTTAAEDQYVTPLYQSTPAPMGLAEYGLRSNATGAIEPFILNTTSVRGTFDPAQSGGPNATYLLTSDPDAYGVQLNSVVTNVTLFGAGGFQFWTQNVAVYFPFAESLVLETNVWNWSSPDEYLSPNVFYAHGPNGTQDGSTFYYAVSGPFHVSYPFDLTSTMVSNLTDGRDSVYFSDTVTSTTGNVSAPDWDYVVFNSLPTGAAPLMSPANYTADGYAYNRIGGTNDFELTIGGPGAGSQTTLLSANATESLDYWNSTTDTYAAIPSAYSYGDETGETSIGASVSWATAPDGAPYGIMTTGPSLLDGLWNASSPSGGPGHVEVADEPGNAFVFFSNANASSFNTSGPEWAPTVHTNSFTLPSGTYVVVVGESDYQGTIINDVVVGPGATVRLQVNLVWDPAMGIYTPLWAWSNAQIGNLSTSGNGTALSPYMIVNQQTEPIQAPFGELNDLGYPVFPGVYFLGTTAYTTFVDPPSLATYVTTNSGTTFPSINDLPWWFYDDANVAIVDAQNISGWFASRAFTFSGDGSSLSFLAFNVIVRNSTGFLFADDDFQTEAAGLLLSGGTDTYVWGNTFTQLDPPTPSYALVAFDSGLALAVQESGDVIYNNRFVNSPTTAVSYPYELYGSVPATYVDTWNITSQAATNVGYAPNWPAYPLTGSVIGTATQGGNFWWDYGVVADYGHSNPYSTLPYNESGEIHLGGDYAPLLYTPLYRITIVPQGLPAATTWTYTVSNSASASEIFALGSAVSPQGAAVNLTAAPIGSYTVRPSTEDGSIAKSVTFNVTGNGTVTVSFVPVYTVTFNETGLPSDTVWSLGFNGTLHVSISSSIVIHSKANGTYSYNVTPSGRYDPTPSSGALTVDGADVVQDVAFAIPASTYSATLTEVGLPAGTLWSVSLNGTPESSTTDAIVVPGLGNGSYDFTVASEVGYLPNPASGTLTVDGADVLRDVAFTAVAVKYAVALTESGLPSGIWSAAINGTTLSAPTGNAIVVNLPNGTFSYSIADHAGYHQSTLPYSGSIVVDGQPVAEPILVFAPVTYAVTIEETGLPLGTNWSVTIAAQTFSSLTSTLVAQEPNGTYAYSAQPAEPYFPQSDGNGNVTVAGAGQSLSVTYILTVALVFAEIGLPIGSTWTVNVSSPGGAIWHGVSTTPLIVVTVPANATYSYQIGVPAGYTTSPSSGSVTVGTSSVLVPPVTAGPTATSTSSDVPWIWVLVGIVAGVIIVIGVAVLLIRRGRSPGTGGGPPSSGPAK